MNTKNSYGWMQTYTGKKLDPLNPRTEDIDIRDIAHGLSLVCRFGGQCPRFYSVGQHSLLTMTLCPGYPLLALMHDACEAYIGDMVRPLKKSMLEFQMAEDNFWAVIAERFELPRCLPLEVKMADNMAMMMERRELGITPIESWGPELEALTLPELTNDQTVFFKQNPQSVRGEFLFYFHKLTKNKFDK